MTKELSDLKLAEMQIMEKIEQDVSEGEITLRKDLQEKADSSQIMMMSVREWLKQQSAKMNLDYSGKSDSQMFKDICSVLKKEKSEQ